MTGQSWTHLCLPGQLTMGAGPKRPLDLDQLQCELEQALSLPQPLLHEALCWYVSEQVALPGEPVHQTEPGWLCPSSLSL